jgi:hypothetical protein
VAGDGRALGEHDLAAVGDLRPHTADGLLDSHRVRGALPIIFITPLPMFMIMLSRKFAP